MRKKEPLSWNATEGWSDEKDYEYFAENFVQAVCYFIPFILTVLALLILLGLPIAIYLSLNQGVEKGKINLTPQRFEISALINEHGNDESHESAVGALVGEIYSYEAVPGNQFYLLKEASHRRHFPRVDGYWLRYAAPSDAAISANKATMPLQRPLGRGSKFGYSIPFGAPYTKQVQRNPIDVVNIHLDTVIDVPQLRRDLRQRAGPKLLPDRVGLLLSKNEEAKGCDCHYTRSGNLNYSQIVHVASLPAHTRSELERLEKRGLEVRG